MSSFDPWAPPATAASQPQPEAGQERPPLPRSPRRGRFWPSLLILTALIIAAAAVLTVGWRFDRTHRRAALAQAHSAFQRGDCRAALTAYASVDSGIVPWGSSVTAAGADRGERPQCEQIKTLTDRWNAGDLAGAARGYAQFRAVHKNSPALVSLYQLVTTSGQSRALLHGLPSKSACTAFQAVRTTSLALEADLNSRASLPHTTVTGQNALTDPANLVACGKTFEKVAQTVTAWDLYSTAINLGPTQGLRAAAMNGMVRITIQRARAVNPTPLLDPPPTSEGRPGTVHLDITNNRVGTLTVAMGGKKPKLLTIAPCANCAQTGAASDQCQTGPSTQFSVPAGTYSVVIESDDLHDDQLIRPLIGNWHLQDGKAYEYCF